jgi:hypothetical protein
MAAAVSLLSNGKSAACTLHGMSETFVEPCTCVCSSICAAKMGVVLLMHNSTLWQSCIWSAHAHWLLTSVAVLWRLSYMLVRMHTYRMLLLLLLPKATSRCSFVLMTTERQQTVVWTAKLQHEVHAVHHFCSRAC